MRFARTLAGLLALLTPAVVLAADEDKKAAPSEPAKTAEKLVQLGVVRGMVKEAVGPAGELLLRVRVRYLEPNAKAQAAYVAEYRQLLARQRAIMLTVNPAQRQNMMQQLLQQAKQLRAKQKDLFQVKEKDTDVELQLPEDARIRLRHLPELFDDKGNIKEYTPAEIKALKGPGGLPGYAGTRDSIQAGQTVYVKVAQKVIPGTAPAKPGSKAPPRKTSVPKGKPLALIVLIEDEAKK